MADSASFNGVAGADARSLQRVALLSVVMAPPLHFTPKLPFELGQRREDAEHEAAGRRGGVNLRALAGEHPQADGACTVLIRWARLRPRRSSFQTTSTSPGRSARTQLSSPATGSRPPSRRGQSRSVCVVNGRLRQTGEGRGGAGAYQRAVKRATRA